jgi:hypothetical protein
VRFLERAIQPEVPFAHPAALNPMTTPPLPEQIELHRDRMWRRDEDLRIESAVDAERFIEDVLINLEAGVNHPSQPANLLRLEWSTETTRPSTAGGT